MKQHKPKRYWNGTDIELGSAVAVASSDLRDPLTVRPENFDELVEREKQLLQERGYIQFRSGKNVVKIYVGGKAKEREDKES